MPHRECARREAMFQLRRGMHPQALPLRFSAKLRGHDFNGRSCSYAFGKARGRLRRPGKSDGASPSPSERKASANVSPRTCLQSQLRHQPILNVRLLRPNVLVSVRPKIPHLRTVLRVSPPVQEHVAQDVVCIRSQARIRRCHILQKTR